MGGRGAGGVVGCWASALMGSALPDPIRRKFHDQIDAGNILVVVDADKDLLTRVEPRVVAAGATTLPYETSKTMS